MTGNDHAGRIPKQAYFASILTFFVLALVSAAARFYVRIGVQKQFSLDDGCLLFGIACLIAAVTMQFTYRDTIYLVEALIFGVEKLELSPNWINDVFAYHKITTASNILTWTAICSVKFSFLFLFKNLIARIRYLVIYWWIVAIFTFAVSVYGAVVFVAVCPHYSTMESLQCGQGAAMILTYKMGMLSKILDILTDVLIVFIPARLIWQIRVQWTQKLALAFSLCLTIVMIVITIIRASGMRSHNKIDVTWSTFWEIMAAEIGIIMTALTAFRQFFVARSNKRHHPATPGKWQQWSSRGRQAFRRIWAPSTRRTKNISQTSSERSDERMELPPIPRGTMTGVRTFIQGQGRTKTGASRIMESHVDEREDRRWHLSRA